jgi:MFS family permease
MPIFNFSFQKTKNLKYIYAIRLVRELANQLMVFFLPVYFFSARFSFMSRFNLPALQEGIFNVVIVYLLTYLVSFFMAIPISKSLTKYGIRHGFLMGHLFYCLFVLCLYLSKNNPYLILTSALINGIQINYFWNTYHYSLSRNSNEAKIGANLGIINFLLNLLAMVAPALGGLIIVALGYQTLFLLGLIIVLSGVIFSVLLDNVRVRDSISFKEFFTWLKEPGFRRLAVSFSGRYFNDASINLWTLYMFILLGSHDSVGYFYSLSLFLALFISYGAGSFIDKNKGRGQFLLSGSFMSIFWLLRGFVFNIWSITVLNAIDKITASFHWLFFDRSWIMRGKGREALSYFVYREMIYSLAAIVFWIFVAAIFFFFVSAWKSLFVAAAIGVLLTLLIKDHKDEELS